MKIFAALSILGAIYAREAYQYKYEDAPLSLRGGGGMSGGRSSQSSASRQPIYDYYNSYSYKDKDGEKVIVPYGSEKYYYDTQYSKERKNPIYSEWLMDPEYLVIVVVAISFASFLLCDRLKLNRERMAENYKQQCGTISITSKVINLQNEDLFDGNLTEQGR